MDNSPAMVSLVYDERMLLHSHTSTSNHPERPARVSETINLVKSREIISNPNLVIRDQAREATLEEISTVHRESYVDFISNMWPEGCDREAINIGSSYFNQHTPLAAKLSTGGGMMALEDLYNGFKYSFALIRPPGHHVCGENSNIWGFCVFNNVAIAAKKAIKDFNCKKVLIFDWDAHHGDGTQNVFYESSEVLYVSLHKLNDLLRQV